MTFQANASARALREDDDDMHAAPALTGLAAKAQRLHDLVRQRDTYFRQPIMADNRMGVMLSLFLAELQAVALNEAALGLANMMEAEERRRVIDTLIHAGLAAVTGATPEWRTVGLTPLGSARMRSFISDYPDI